MKKVKIMKGIVLSEQAMKNHFPLAINNMKKHPKKIKQFVIEIRHTACHYRYFNAPSAKAALKAYENGDINDMEYDFDECCQNDDVVSIKLLKKGKL